jgi:hypothetical protein
VTDQDHDPGSVVLLEPAYSVGNRIDIAWSESAPPVVVSLALATIRVVVAGAQKTYSDDAVPGDAAGNAMLSACRTAPRGVPVNHDHKGLDGVWWRVAINLDAQTQVLAPDIVCRQWLRAIGRLGVGGCPAP